MNAYPIPDAPYFLLTVGLLASLTSGFAFYSTLTQAVGEWAKTRSPQSLDPLKGISLLMPFFGIALGICGFLASSLEIFSFTPPFTYVVSLALTLATGGLVWFQLQRVLVQVEKGGLKSLDLDSFG